MNDKSLIALIGITVIVLLTGKIMRWILPARQVARKQLAPRGCGGAMLVLLMLFALWELLNYLVSDPVAKAQSAVTNGGDPFNQMIAGIVSGILFGGWLLFGMLKIQIGSEYEYTCQRRGHYGICSRHDLHRADFSTHPFCAETIWRYPARPGGQYCGWSISQPGN